MAITIKGMPVCRKNTQAFLNKTGKYICKCDRYFGTGDSRAEAFGNWKALRDEDLREKSIRL